ncbi:uncharacterized protein LOC133527779 [Cydia pomonella]|uniref:uncharacterized protein LOC133527779 n=1 Tax=Cydia pomonella TaxID=82600 RepID=UPI002ADE73FC|nr:uncharacterized protein LOC133527779 [Cydia pomonella]
MKIIVVFCVIKFAWTLGNSYNYEKKSYGLGRRVYPRINPSHVKYLPMFDTALRPSPLPPPKRNLFSGTNYHNLTQGFHITGNTRVYSKVFDYPEREQGQQAFFRGDYNCILSRLAVDTGGCLPTLLRGGVGYRYFLVLVRAPSGHRMKGRVRAWCRNTSDEYATVW